MEPIDTLSVHKQSIFSLRDLPAGGTHWTGELMLYFCFLFAGLHRLKFLTCARAASTMELGSRGRALNILSLRDFHINHRVATISSLVGESIFESKKSIIHLSIQEMLSELLMMLILGSDQTFFVQSQSRKICSVVSGFCERRGQMRSGIICLL